MENAVEHTMSWLKSKSSILSSDILPPEDAKSTPDVDDNMMMHIRADEHETDVKRKVETININNNEDNAFGNINQTESMKRSEDESDGTKTPVNDIEAVLEGPEQYEEKQSYIMEDYVYKTGDVNCLWVPNKPSTTREFGYRIKTWLFLNGKQIAAGITVATTQIVEAVSHALIAGVNPVMAVQSALIFSLVASIIGGRPGLISGSTSMTAVALAGVVKNHGVEYIFYTVGLSGIMQLLYGILGLGAITRLIPYTVLTGFINASAFIIFLAQFEFLKIEPLYNDSSRKLLQTGYAFQAIENGKEWASRSVLGVVCIEVTLAVLICYFLPKWTTRVSSVAVAVLSVTVVEWILIRQLGFAGPLLGDYEEISGVIAQKYPTPVFVDEQYDLPPMTVETLQKVVLPATAIFGSNLVQSILTKIYLDERNGTKGHTNRMIVGNGFAQFISCLFGGLGGGGSLSLSMVNHLAGGYTYLSQFVAAVTLLFMISFAAPVFGSIPLGGVIGIMLFTAGSLFQADTFIKIGSSIFPLKARERLNLNYKIQRSEAIIVLAVFLISLFVDIGIAAIIGMTMAVYVYAWDSGDRIMILREIDPDEETVTYYISGHLFFATQQICLETFTQDIIDEDPNDVILNLEGAEVFDWSGMLALRTLHDRLVDSGKVVAFSSLSASSRRLMEKCSSMWEGINFLFIEEITEEEKTVTGSMFAGTTVSSKVTTN